MRSTRFSSSRCHSMQHKVILQVMREGEQGGTKVGTRVSVSP